MEPKKETKSIIMYLAALIPLLQSCDLVGGIFKAGIWTGVIAIILGIAIIIYIIVKIVNWVRKSK